MRNEIEVDRLGIPVMNKIFVKIQDIETEFTTKGGIIAKSDFAPDAWSNAEGHSVTEFIPRHGVVAAVPKIITAYGWDFDTDCEIQVGDTVFWSVGSFENHTVLCCNDEKFLSIDYHAILIRIRNGNILPINGNILLAPVAKEKTALRYTVAQKTSNLWDIVTMPEKIPVSKKPHRNGELPWSEGDRVILMVGMNAIKIEGDINKSLEKELYVIPWWMVLCDVKKETV